MKFVYVLMAHTEYECSELVNVFAKEDEAEDVCRRANLHLEARPECATGSTDDEYDAWDVATEEWKSKHPAGTGYQYSDSFSLAKMELIGA